jgi:HAD superfamily hydrolase (TIGR01484 family)
MRYHALATDYDGTLAGDGRIEPSTAEALKRLKGSGRRLIMVTGRVLEELLAVCPQAPLFDRIVAENGAVLYNPADRSLRALGERPPPEFLDDLRRRGVDRVALGHVIVATWEPHQKTVLAAIRDHGLALQVIFNKGAVMILPAGVNKDSGLRAALRELGLSPHNVVGVGDAENDQAFLSICEAAAAVANALPSVRERCDWTADRPRGQGVSELIGQLLEDDLQILESRLQRHHIVIGDTVDEQAIGFSPYGVNLMICGTSGSGRSRLTTGLIEQIAEHGYQIAICDPEGDYEALEFAVDLGTPDDCATADEVLAVLANPHDNVSINLLGVQLEDRPDYFHDLLPRLLKMRASGARPHWILVDEAHHMLPAGWKPVDDTWPAKIGGMLYITVHPESVSRAVLDTVDTLIVVGQQPAASVARFCRAVGAPSPRVPRMEQLKRGEAIVWRCGEPAAVLVNSRRSLGEHKRQLRKYADGDLGPERSFYFRGPARSLNLRAHNLRAFLQLADGVDDDTWTYHLQRGDISRWFGDGGINDTDLAQEAGDVERRAELSAADSRIAIRQIIERRYTGPAELSRESPA